MAGRLRLEAGGLFMLALALVGAISMQLLSPTGAQHQPLLEHYGGPLVDHSIPPKITPWAQGLSSPPHAAQLGLRWASGDQQVSAN